VATTDIAPSAVRNRKVNASGHSLSASILIVPAYPLHRNSEAVLIAAFRRKVEVMVGTIEHVHAPRVAGIGVEHLAILILVEDADSDLVRSGSKMK